MTGTITLYVGGEKISVKRYTCKEERSYFIKEWGKYYKYFEIGIVPDKPARGNQ